MAVPPCPQCATVVALHEVKVEGEGTGLGAVGGGVAGGVVGNALGSGRGRDVMTVLGAIGGAFAGNAIEKNARSKIDYEIVVRFENGHTRRFKRPQPWPYSVGEPVRVVKGELLPVHG
jgi:outer membrane lipoprotein SlyB